MAIPPSSDAPGDSRAGVQATVRETAQSFTAAPGVVLAGHVFEPLSPVGAAASSPILIAGGLGVAQRFYAPFARWLAARGHCVMTFDLRGMGESRAAEHRHSLKGLNADMLTWARQDFPAAVHCLLAHTGAAKLDLIGHSLGVHHALMTDEATQRQIRMAVSVAAGSGYWRDWAAPSRRLAPLMLHLAIPVSTTLLGYFPGKRLGMVGDLPGPAARQWSRWCRHPQFAWGVEPTLVLPSFRSARFAVEAFSFTDDDAMTETCTRQLLAAAPHVVSQVHRVAPAEVALHAIGHVGAFRREAQGQLWPRLVEALQRPPSGARGGAVAGAGDVAGAASRVM